MKVSKIVVSFESTINLGNYQNIKPSLTMEVVLGDGEDAEAAASVMQKKVRTLVATSVAVRLAEAVDYRSMDNADSPQGVRSRLGYSPQFGWLEDVEPETATRLVDDVYAEVLKHSLAKVKEAMRTPQEAEPAEDADVEYSTPDDAALF